MPYRNAAPMALLACLLAGCTPTSFVLADPAYRAERSSSWVVVVEVPREPPLDVPARQVGRLVAAELALRWFNVLDRDLLVQANPDLGPALRRAARGALTGERADPQLAERLLRRHGVGQLLAVDVFRHEQVWGRETRITRVGAEAHLVQLGDGKVLWQGRADPAISGATGSAFDTAARRAAEELVRQMCESPPSFGDTPFATWPVLEYFTPN
jgi:hypothetical protein